MQHPFTFSILKSPFSITNSAKFSFRLQRLHFTFDISWFRPRSPSLHFDKNLIRQCTIKIKQHLFGTPISIYLCASHFTGSQDLCTKNVPDEYTSHWHNFWKTWILYSSQNHILMLSEFIVWYDHFLDSWAKSCQIFSLYFWTIEKTFWT